MPYFSYHGRNKKLIKEGFLEDYFYLDEGDKRVMILVFKNGTTKYVTIAPSTGISAKIT